MPARDTIHDAVKQALIKDGWTITHDPFVIEFEDKSVFVDLAAEKVIAAERGTDKIVVEIKSFLGASPVRDFQQALGQYDMYRTLLGVKAADRRLFLGISREVFQLHFEAGAIGYVAKQLAVPLVVVDIQKQEVVRWTS